jgi:hypothetical protein
LVWGLRNVDLARLGINISDANATEGGKFQSKFPKMPRVPFGHKTEKEAEHAAANGESVPPAAEAPVTGTEAV